jgi:hypothetical protein
VGRIGGWWLAVGGWSWCMARAGVVASGQGRRILSNNIQPAFTSRLQTWPVFASTLSDL